MRSAIVFDFKDGDFHPRELYRRVTLHENWRSRRRAEARLRLREWWKGFVWELVFMLVCVAVFGGLYLIATAKYGG